MDANSIDKITVKDSSRKTTWTDMNSVADSIAIEDFEINVGQE